MTQQFQCINPNGASKQRALNAYDENFKWEYLEVGYVDEAFVPGYLADSASFTKVQAGDVVAGEPAVYDPDGKIYRSSASPAAAGSTVTDATPLTAEFNYVTGANGANGVLLPVAAANEIVTVINADTTAGNSLNVYAITGSQINALGSTVAFVLNPGQTGTFVGRSATLWNTAQASDTISGLTASAAELNVLHTATATSAEISSLHGEPAAVSMTTTPASGSCAVQLTVKDAAGAALAHAVSGLGYLSSSTGLGIAGATSNATLTNGSITDLVAGKVFQFITSAVGLLGVTVTAPAGSYYITLQLPNGMLVTTGEIVVNS